MCTCDQVVIRRFLSRLKPNVQIAVCLSAVVVALVVVDIIGMYAVEAEHYTAIGGLIAAFLGIHQSVATEPRQPRQGRQHRETQRGK